MTLNEAILVLMQAATNDVVGQGCGMRNTTDKWRVEVTKAWEVAFKRVYKRMPGANEYRNAGMYLP